jgi:hypothetical protein
MNRSERRKARNNYAAARHHRQTLDPAGVVGVLDDSRAWSAMFASPAEARSFLKALGPPPASEERLRTALRMFGQELKL